MGELHVIAIDTKFNAWLKANLINNRYSLDDQNEAPVGHVFRVG